MFPSFISILDIQSWWEVPSIAHFCSLFRAAFNLLDFDIEELEEALLTDGTSESDASGGLLQELIVRLLCGCLQNNDISTFNYQMFLRRLFRQKFKNSDQSNPFNTDIDFQFLPLRRKVEILRTLCDFRLDSEDVFELLKNLEAESLRVEPLGWDSNKSAYWYFYGTRLYREDFGDPKNNKKQKKSVWQVICFTESDWISLTQKFKKSKTKDERALFRTLSSNFLPEIPRLFAEKERQQRKRLLATRHRSTKKVEENHEKKMAPARQTNNSLASATGQILIQKPKPKQVFHPTLEDLQVGMFKILQNVKNHNDAWPFIDPVEEDYAPNYYSIVSKPMDLQKMEEKLEAGEYTNFKKFKADFQLIVHNCRVYNGTDNEYTEMVDNLQEAFQRAQDRFLDQIDSEEEPAPPPPPPPTEKKQKRVNRKKRKRPVSPPPESPPPLPPPSKKKAESPPVQSKPASVQSKPTAVQTKPESIQSNSTLVNSKSIPLKSKPSPPQSKPASVPSKPAPVKSKTTVQSKPPSVQSKPKKIETPPPTIPTPAPSATPLPPPPLPKKNLDLASTIEKLKNKTKKKPPKTKTEKTPAELLDLATEQTLKDINKWLDSSDTAPEIEPPSSPPMTSIDDFDLVASNLETNLAQEQIPVSTTPVVPVPPITAPPVIKEVVKPRKPISKKQRKQRTIERLQPGKSKGNLITKPKEETLVAAKIKAPVEPENLPKLSLGTVLDSFGEQHNFSDNNPEPVEEPEAKPQEPEIEPEVKPVEEPPVPEPKEHTPNLSAWFKAFGAPKTVPPPQPTLPPPKKSIEEESRIIEAPAPRIRKASTGSSVSEQSSMDSPRLTVDERSGMSPMTHRSEGASPQMDHTNYPPPTVGFYQDTVSPEKSPLPKSPIHVYIPPTELPPPRQEYYETSPQIITPKSPTITETHPPVLKKRPYTREEPSDLYLMENEHIPAPVAPLHIPNEPLNILNPTTIDLTGPDSPVYEPTMNMPFHPPPQSHQHPPHSTSHPHLQTTPLPPHPQYFENELRIPTRPPENYQSRLLQPPPPPFGLDLAYRYHPDDRFNLPFYEKSFPPVAPASVTSPQSTYCPPSQPPAPKAPPKEKKRKSKEGFQPSVPGSAFNFGPAPPPSIITNEYLDDFHRSNYYLAQAQADKQRNQTSQNPTYPPFPMLNPFLNHEGLYQQYFQQARQEELLRQQMGLLGVPPPGYHPPLGSQMRLDLGQSPTWL